MIHPLLRHGRILFVVQGCPRCAIWEEFIEQLNSELKFDKMIKVIDCTRFHDLGIYDDPIIELFMPYVQGYYPTLFFEGRVKNGATTRLEVESWIRSKVYEDMEIKQDEWLPQLQTYARFNKQCKFGEKGYFKRKIICE